MADVKISALPAKTTLANTDVMVVVDSATKKITVDNVRSDVVAQSQWRERLASTYTSIAPSTSQINMSNTSGITVGKALRVMWSGTYKYFVVATVVTNNSITVRGPALDLVASITAIEVGGPGTIAQVDIPVSGLYATATNTTLLASNKIPIRWLSRDAYLVDCHMTHGTADGISQPYINPRINGSRVLLNNTGLGLQLSTAGTWVDAGVAAINSASYLITRTQALELECSQAAGGLAAEDLMVSLQFVLP